MAATITDTQGIITIAAAAVAVVALILALALLMTVRRLRAAQQQVLGGEQLDLVSHAAGMQDAFEALRQYVEEVAVRLDGRLSDTETALRRAIAHRALVRYDAYNELSGRQSVSIALLDDERSGIVLSCIHHRDQARVYAKHMQGGEPELELSPEEAEAVRLALTLSPAGADGDNAEHSA